MPFLNLKTNVEIPKEKESIVIENLTRAVTLMPGKPYDGIMVEIEESAAIFIGGERKPIAFVSIDLYGKQEESVYTDVYTAIREFLSGYLEIPENSIFVNFHDDGSWGVVGKMFI